MAALERLLPSITWTGAAFAAGAGVVSWMIYVPLHELAHAYGCIVSGGSVTSLEIDSIYGARWMATIFPFVTVGSEYAGQLTGFDTGGSDLVYLATDFAPFVFTIAVGVPLLRSVPRIRNPTTAMAALGAAIPIAYAPFISIPGDFYEMGSIIVSACCASRLGYSLERWRGDDVFLLVEQVRSAGGGPFDWLAIGAALGLGFVLALATYSAGAVMATALQPLWRSSPKASEADTSE